MWKPGTLLVCIDASWVDPADGSKPAPGEAPAKGDYVTVDQHYADKAFKSGYGVTLVEYLWTGNAFCESAFRLAESDHCESKTVACVGSIVAP